MFFKEKRKTIVNEKIYNTLRPSRAIIRKCRPRWPQDGIC